jgi:hypothetical protein
VTTKGIAPLPAKNPRRRARALGPVRPLPVFAYGPLLEKTLVENLLEHRVESEPALLDGFRVLLLEELSFPVLRPDKEGRVEGRLYRGLSGEDLHRIDAYRGVQERLYRRAAVTVLPEGGPAEEAFVYLPTERTLVRYATRRE